MLKLVKQSQKWTKQQELAQMLVTAENNLETAYKKAAISQRTFELIRDGLEYSQTEEQTVYDPKIMDAAVKTAANDIQLVKVLECYVEVLQERIKNE